MSEDVKAKEDRAIRLYALDLCRGMCALGVASYHFSLWGGAVFSPFWQSTLALFGTYGVSVFFVLSGYSLAHAYCGEFLLGIESVQLGAYFRRRIGRLLPLFVVVLFASCVGKAMRSSANPIEPMTVLVNLTLLFGFVNPAATPVIGGWSIGVEVVFYVVFPLIMLLRNWAAAMLVAATILTAWISTDIAKSSTLADAWSDYVVPANHLLFFCAGVLARLYSTRWHITKGGALTTLFVILVVATATVAGATELEMVTGLRRAVLVGLCVALVAVVGRLKVTCSTLRSISNAMGGASYPLYLVHPLIFFGTRRIIDGSGIVGWLTLVVLALFIAIIADRYADIPIQRRIKSFGW